MPICIECSYPVPQLYHVLLSRNHKKPPPLPPKPKPKSTSTSSIPSKKAASKSTSSLRGLHESFKSSFRSSDSRPSEEADAKADNAYAKNTAGGAGTDVRLTQCPRCKRFADKYVEHDFVVLFIDLVLLKPQVYRHLLFNRLHASSTTMDPSIIRLAILLLLFDVYITWSHIESLPAELTFNSKITSLPLLLQYLFFLVLSFSATLSQHLIIRCLASWAGLSSNSSVIPSESSATESKAASTTTTTTTTNYSSSSEGSSPNPNTIIQSGHNRESTNTNSTTIPPPTPPPPPRPTSNAISTALTVSSSMSLFPLLMVVWNYSTSSSPPSTSPPFSPISANTSPSPLISPRPSTFATGFLPISATPSADNGGIDWVRTGVAGIVFVQNWEALRILLGCGYFTAGGLVAAGGLVRAGVRGLGLGWGGLGGG